MSNDQSMKDLGALFGVGTAEETEAAWRRRREAAEAVGREAVKAALGPYREPAEPIPQRDGFDRMLDRLKLEFCGNGRDAWVNVSADARAVCAAILLGFDWLRRTAPLEEKKEPQDG